MTQAKQGQLAATHRLCEQAYMRVYQFRAEVNFISVLGWWMDASETKADR